MSAIDFPALLHILDLAVFERHDDDTYAVGSPMPGWADDIVGAALDDGRVALRTCMPFLDHFLTDADAFWWGRKDGAVASSPFIVAGTSGETDYLLRAWAVRQGSLQLIVVLNLRGEADLRPVLQTAREQQLEYDALVRHLAPVHGAVDALARASQQLQSAAPPDGAQRDAIATIARAADALQAVAGNIPPPPKGTRGFKA